MKPLIAASLLAWLAAMPLSIAQVQRPAANRFAWLEGCWAGERGPARFQEIWVAVTADLMLGMGMTTEPSKPTEFEFVRIETRAGKPAYVAQPQGVPPTVFDLSAPQSGADSAIFVNPAHDFPKRVGYRRVDASSILAFIDGGDTGTGRMEFPMTRVACPGGR
jgi:hypothetical protein